MRNSLVLVEVLGGVAELTYQDLGVNVIIWDWDNYKAASPKVRQQMRETLPEKLYQHLFPKEESDA